MSGAGINDARRTRLLLGRFYKADMVKISDPKAEKKARSD